MTLLFLSVILFLIIDPVGNVPIYLKLMKRYPKEKQTKIAIREMLIALGVMLLFNELGELLFQVLGLSEIGLRIASGVILFLIALKILFPGQGSIRKQEYPEELFVFPLAIPLLAGPATLATIMLYAHLESSRSIMFLAILIAWAASCLVLYNSATLLRIFGSNGLAAAERLMGMILVLISIQRIATGFQLFITGKCCD